jgi:UDP-N-acetylglucosamine 3-dehydrogenase
MSTKPPIKVAVIGAGNMGRHHVRNYAMLPESELVALADINPDSAKLAKEYKAKFFTDYKEMLEEMKPQAISIVVPTPLHLEVGTYAMERGIHCLVEKPIAYSIKEADALIGLAEKNKLVFTVGHIERYNPIVRKLKEIMDEKRLGKVTSIVCRRVGGFPAVEPKTDVVIDLAVHDIDIINYLLGRLPSDIHSHGSQTHHTKKIDASEILLDYGNASGFIQANWVTPVKIRTISITGSDGYVEGNYITQELMYYHHNMQEVKNGSFSSFVMNLGEPEQEMIPVDFEEPLAVELKTFLSVIGGSKKTELVPPWDAREALRLSLIAIKKYEEE